MSYQELFKSLIWPITILMIVIILRSSISKLLLLIVKIKYKDLTIWFHKEIKKVESEISYDEFAGVEEKITEQDKSLKKLCCNSHVQAILESWEKVEQSIYIKLKDLFPQESLQSKRLTLDRACTELFLIGALPPSSEKLIDELRRLRNQVEHYPGTAISSDDALKYISLAKRIQNQVESLTELPIVKLTPLAGLIISINHLIDTGKYNDISLNDIKIEIEKGTVLQYLQDKAKDDIDLSIILNGTTYPGFEEFYIDNLQRICNVGSGNERRKWGIENLGLCLLLAWTNEIIQQGSGWYPSD